MADYAEATTIVGPSGSMADVKDHSLLTRPRSRFQHAVRHGDAYSFASVTFNPTAHDTILGVQNIDPDRDLYIEAIWASSDTASQVQIFEAADVTMTGTAVVGVNLNRAAGRVPLATAKANETNNGEQGTGYAKLLFRDLLAANTPKRLHVAGGIVIPYGLMIGIDLTTTATGAAMTIFGWYE